MTRAPLPLKEWILIPAVITLAITLIRLIGELMNWSPALFSRAGGGAGAIIGIVWLIPVLGVHFALKLRSINERPESLGRGFGRVVLAIALIPIAGLVASRVGINGTNAIVVVCLAFLGSIFVASPAWPALARVMWAYGLAARIPVMLVMLVAIFANWGTHYDVAPPGFPAVSPFVKWLLIGVFPQLTLWMGFTVVGGMLFGLITIAVSGKKA